MGKKWKQLKGKEKTKAQEINLLLQELKRTEKTPPRDDWKHLSGAEKTRQQEIQLLIREQSLDDDYLSLDGVDDELWNFMDSMEKTNQEIDELLLKEDKRVSGKKKMMKEAQIEDFRKKMWFFKRRSMLLAQEAQRRAAAEQFNQQQLKKYVQKELIPLEQLAVKSDSGLEAVVEKKKVKLYMSKLEGISEKAAKHNWKFFDFSEDRKDLEKKELELSKLQEQMVNYSNLGYDVDLSEQ
jgi:hypothetical protein